MKKVVTVLAHRASKKDPEYSFTYRTNQFPQWTINSGDEYFVEYENGEVLYLKASRLGDTLYRGKGMPHSQPLPQIGSKVEHRIVKIAKVLKQLEI